ncbi:MAG TPA: peptidylprolyl isomerase [Bacillota bacterium]|nr:peptidylprolyl isomerase [Bacillota bacterium]
MSKKLLLGIIIILLITNIATLLFWSKNKREETTIEENDVTISSTDPVATIDKDTITYDEWMDDLRNNYGKQQLKSMIDHHIVNKLAAEKNIIIDDKVLDREVAHLTTMAGIMTKEEAARREKEWREAVEYRYQLEMLLTDGEKVPEADIREFYDNYHKQYDFEASIQLSHIVLPNMETAEKVKRELDSGASFGLLAQEYSVDEETKDDGGYLGFFVHTSQFIPDGYVEKVSEMKEHSYSKPFETDDGVAIIYLHRKLPTITFTYEEIKPYIKNELALERTDQSLTADPLWNKFDIDWIYE